MKHYVAPPAPDAPTSSNLEVKMQRRIYLAGPEVFLPDAIAMGERKKAICAKHGFVGLFPFDNEVVQAEGGPNADELIYRGNVGMMRECDLAILNLSPFRGPGADPGTAFELGYLTALGKPCLGYTNDTAPYIDRVRRVGPVRWDAETGYWRDGDSLSIEDFGGVDSLMIDRAIATCGIPIMRHDGGESPLSDLVAFERCVTAAAVVFDMAD